MPQRKKTCSTCTCSRGGSRGGSRGQAGRVPMEGLGVGEVAVGSAQTYLLSPGLSSHRFVEGFAQVSL